MEVKYITVDGTQHIILRSRTLGDKNMCDVKIPQDAGPGRKLRYPKTDMCIVCLENFKASDHPEAVAYRAMFEAAV